MSVKKIGYSILLVLFISCVFTGCDNIVDETFSDVLCEEPMDCNVIDGNSLIQYSDGFLYFYNIFPNMPGGQPEGRTLMRLAVNSDILTSVCSLPNCTHNTQDCPFYGMIPVMFIHGNRLVSATLIDESEDGQLTKTIKTINLDTNEVVVRESSKSKSGSIGTQMLIYENAAYFMSSKSDSNTGVDSVIVYQWNLDTNQIINLCEFTNPVFSSPYDMPYQILFVLKNRLFYKWNKTIYSASFDFSEKKLIRETFDPLEVLTDGEHIYYGIQSEGHRENIETLYMADADLQNETNLGITAERGKIHLTNDWIYWTEYDEITLGKCRVTGYDSDELVLEGSEIWRCRHDGTEKELVFRFDGDLAGTRFLYEIIVGDELYGIYTTWTDKNGDGVFQDGDQTESIGYDEYFIMKIHIPSGDVSIIDGILK